MYVEFIDHNPVEISKSLQQDKIEIYVLKKHIAIYIRMAFIYIVHINYYDKIYLYNIIMIYLRHKGKKKNQIFMYKQTEYKKVT